MEQLRTLPVRGTVEIMPPGHPGLGGQQQDAESMEEEQMLQYMPSHQQHPQREEGQGSFHAHFLCAQPNQQQDQLLYHPGVSIQPQSYVCMQQPQQQQAPGHVGGEDSGSSEEEDVDDDDGHEGGGGRERPQGVTELHCQPQIHHHRHFNHTGQPRQYGVAMQQQQQMMMMMMMPIYSDAEGQCSHGHQQHTNATVADASWTHGVAGAIGGTGGDGGDDDDDDNSDNESSGDDEDEDDDDGQNKGGVGRSRAGSLPPTRTLMPPQTEFIPSHSVRLPPEWLKATRPRPDHAGAPSAASLSLLASSPPPIRAAGSTRQLPQQQDRLSSVPRDGDADGGGGDDDEDVGRGGHDGEISDDGGGGGGGGGGDNEDEDDDDGDGDCDGGGSEAGGRRRRGGKGWTKPRDKPKKFKSAYILFGLARRECIKRRLGAGASNAAVVSAAAEEWNALGDARKAFWKSMEEEERRSYHAAVAAYDGPDLVRQKRRKIHQDAPKRPMTAYLLYSQHIRNLEKQARVAAATAAPSGYGGGGGRRRRVMGLPTESQGRRVAEQWKRMTEEEKAPYTAEAKAHKVRYEEAMRQWRDQQRTAKQAKLKEYADELRAREERYFDVDDPAHGHHHGYYHPGYIDGGRGDAGREGGGGGRRHAGDCSGGGGDRDNGGVASSHQHDTSPHSQAPPLAFTTTLTSEDGGSVQPVLMVLPRPLPPLSQRGLDTIMGDTHMVPPAPAAHVLALPAGYTVAPHTNAITLAPTATTTPQPHHA